MTEDAEDAGSSRPVSESEMFAHIASNAHVFYKNQQINEPEISGAEKENILRQVLSKSHGTFLSRFGLFMQEDHLRYFEQDEQTLAYSPDERYEIDHHLERIRRLKNGGRAVDVRNRRYAALLKLCQDGSYFSEQEMMQREPLLYDQLVGQYMTEREKRERDASVPLPRSVVSIIYNQIDKDQAQETLHQQEQEECRQEASAKVSGGWLEESNRHSRPNSPGFPRPQWGNFDDEEESRLEMRLQERHKKARERQSTPAHLMTADERQLLRDEFNGIMYARFIAGEDKEFDYSQVDDSLEYDDLDIVEQDEQEKYFDDDEDEPEAPVCAEGGLAGEESEDDLDVYMRHLEQGSVNGDGAPRFREPQHEYESDE
ncbi:coiled-coil domain-containing protein 97 [Anopheles cruzii]|uniref:coiled-coil domain-containing protein 97 n=1 Tax=Anopheles cruzii TaxID=68878 RepID=UPI0022EC76D3|nr:coiled-coil domain-containing protein 97 [Anopheles cruzii]